MGDKLFIVGHVYNQDIKNVSDWSFEGVFSSRDIAESKCLNEFYFVGPCEVDKELESLNNDWPDAYYPKREIKQ